MEHAFFYSVVLALIFSWEEFKGLFRLKQKIIPRVYLDQLVADSVFLATLPIAIMIVLTSAENFSHTLLFLIIELVIIFVFIEIARFVTRHTDIFSLDSWSESIVAVAILVPKIYSPFPLARFYNYKFRFGRKLILDLTSSLIATLTALVIIKNFAPEFVYQNLYGLVIIFTALTFSLVILNHLNSALHSSRHPFWTNFRILAGIIIVVVITLK